MRRLVLAVALVGLSIVPVSSASAGYGDPVGDYTRSDPQDRHPDIRAVLVTSADGALTFEVSVVRAPQNGMVLDIFLDTDAARGNHSRTGRLRKTDVMLEGRVSEPGPVYAATGFGKHSFSTRAGAFRVAGKVARLTIPRRLTMKPLTGKAMPVQIPKRFALIVWAQDAVDIGIDDEPPPWNEDWAPNIGWFQYLP